ncbi:MAG: hypothetical protein Q9160_000143 [Pyrenula sp. 1 TL-2023]
MHNSFGDSAPDNYLAEEDDLFPGLSQASNPLEEQFCNELSEPFSCSIECCNSPECGPSMEEIFGQCCNFEGCPENEECLQMGYRPDAGATQASELDDDRHRHHLANAPVQLPSSEATLKRLRTSFEASGDEPQDHVCLLDDKSRAQTPHIGGFLGPLDTVNANGDDDRLREAGKSANEDSGNHQTSSKTASRKRRKLATQKMSKTTGQTKEGKKIFYRCTYPWEKGKNGRGCNYKADNASNRNKHAQRHWEIVPYGCYYPECTSKRKAKPDNLTRHLESGACPIHKKLHQPIGKDLYPLPDGFSSHKLDNLAQCKAHEEDSYKKKLQQWLDAGNDRPPDRGWAYVNKEGKFQRWCDEPL